MRKKFMPISKEQLSKLPVEVQEKVKSTLRVYSECNVTFEYGRYWVCAGVCIKSEYGADHEFIGVAYADDIYTLEERTQNYIEAFHSYPSWYTGKRDYVALREKYGEPCEWF